MDEITRLEQELKTWDGVNPHISEPIKHKLRKIILKKVKKELPTEKELYALNKAEQLVLLSNFGIIGKQVPKYEKDRVALIMELNRGV